LARSPSRAGTANSYAGHNPRERRHAGADKTPFDGAIPGDLIIGDGVGGANADVVRVLKTSQINNYATVTIASSGLLDLTSGGDAVGGLNGSGNINLGANFVNSLGSGSYTFDGVISGTGIHYVDGPGIYTFNGNNLYTGQTYIEPSTATVRINGFQPQSPVLLSSGTTLGGSGTVGNIAAYGIVSPGTSPGILSCSNATFYSGANFTVELKGPTAGTDYDQLNVRGTASLANATLTVLPAFTTPVAVGQQFTIIANDGTDANSGTSAAWLKAPRSTPVATGSRSAMWGARATTWF